MKKILLILSDLGLLCIIIFALFYFDKNSIESKGNKNMFIPYKSAMVVNINYKKNSSTDSRDFFDRFIGVGRFELLRSVVDSPTYNP